MVKFKLNKQLDIDMASQFLGTQFGGIDFGRSITDHHTQLRNVSGSDEVVIRTYFDNFYEEKQPLLEQRAEVFQSQWDKVEPSFIAETEQLFNGYTFPEGKYVGYVSSFDCNPRFLEDKTFQLFHQHKSSINVTSHEMMHFIFYSYTAENLEDITRGLDTNNGLWWDAAEVFNSVILSTDTFTQILNTQGDEGYPDHEKYIPEAKEIYGKGLEISEYIRELF